MSGWKGIVDAFSQALAANIDALGQPPLNGMVPGDGKVLFGQHFVADHDAPPRVVLVAQGWSQLVAPRTANPATLAVPKGVTYRNATQMRSLRTMPKRFVVHCWAVNFTNGQPVPDPDGGDLDALDQIVRAIVVTAAQITTGIYTFGDATIVTSKPTETQHVRLGAYAIFQMTLDSPVEDIPLGGTASPTVKPSATTQIVPPGGGTPETGCTS